MYQGSKRLHVIFMTHFYWQLLTDHLRKIQIKWDEEAVEMIKTDKDTKKAWENLAPVFFVMEY